MPWRHNGRQKSMKTDVKMENVNGTSCVLLL